MGANESKLEDEEDAGDTQRTYDLDVLQDHSGAINCMTVSEDGSILATGSDDNTIRLWTAKAPRCDCIGILSGHEGYITCAIIEEIFVFSGSVDKTVRKWDMATCVCLAVYSGHEERINRLISTGDFVFSSSTDATVRCWDVDDGHCIREFAGHLNSVFPLMYIPYDDEEDDCSNDARSLKDDTEDRQGSASSELSSVTTRSDNMKINDVLITGSTDCTVRSWSFEKGRTLHIFSGHTGPVTCLGVDADGKVLITGSTDGSVRSWDIKSGTGIRVFEAHTQPIVCMTVVDRMVVTGSSDCTACAFLLNSYKPPMHFSAHKKTIICIKAVEGILLTGSSDGTVLCWDIIKSCIKRKFIGPPNSVVSTMQVVENRLYTGSTDGSLRLWTLKGLRSSETKQPASNNTAAEEEDVARQRSAAEQ